MKILFLNGSPKSGASASGLLINALCQRLGDTTEHTMLSVMGLCKQDFFEQVKDKDAMVVVFPLYVDGIPSHLLRLLHEVKNEIKSINPELIVYAVANNGFYEGEQNALALSMMQHFCVAAGIKWGQGLGIGAGGMANAAPIGAGPLKNIGMALNTLASNIKRKATGDDFFTQPNFPKFLYKLGGHFNWKSAAKKNGLKRKDLYKQW